MMTGFKKEQVFDAIEGAFQAFYVVARKKTQEKWKKMPRLHKYAAARALVVMRDVAQNPEKHFSRANTEGAWKLRAAEYAKQNGVAEGWAYYFVNTPTDVILDSVDAAFIEEPALRNAFSNFCDDVKDWYYAAASADLVHQAGAARVADKIVGAARNIRKQADIIKDGRVMYWLMHSKVKNILFQKPYEEQR